MLSIDGGGVRGIIPARGLAEIEQRTGKPIASLFDLIAGNSIGGIMALFLNRPDEHGKPRSSAEDLLVTLEKSLPWVLPRSVWRRIPIINLIADTLRARYRPKNLEQMLAVTFEDATMGDAVTNVLIGAYDIDRGEPRMFTNQGADRDLLMRDVARATSAAPGLYPPAVLNSGPGGSSETLVDAAIFATNPAISAYAEMRSRGFADEDLLLVSLSTGRDRCRINHRRSGGWGLLKWLPNVVRLAMDGGARIADRNLDSIMSGDGPTCYYRIDADLPPALASIDNASPNHIEAVRAFADRLVDSQSASMDELCEALLRDDSTH